MRADSAAHADGADGTREGVDILRRATAALRTSAARRFDGGTLAATSAGINENGQSDASPYPL